MGRLLLHRLGCVRVQFLLVLRATLKYSKFGAWAAFYSPQDGEFKVALAKLNIGDIVHRAKLIDAAGHSKPGDQQPPDCFNTIDTINFQFSALASAHAHAVCADQSAHVVPNQHTLSR